MNTLLQIQQDIASWAVLWNLPLALDFSEERDDSVWYCHTLSNAQE